ncbi:hypothetical protein [Thiomonas sp.]
MSRIDLDPTQRLVDVDWDTPEMQALLRKTAHLHIDQRNVVTKRPVMLRLGWYDRAEARPALWVDRGEPEADRIVLTQYPLEVGDPVMLEIRRPQPKGAEAVYAEVLSCRKGQRIDDDGLYVLKLRDNKRMPGAVTQK